MLTRRSNIDPHIGSVIAGRFTVERLVGRGGMGSVYVALHAELGRKYAVKFLHESIESDAELAERFRREARAISRLDHPGIVSVADFGRTEHNQLYLVMEYVDGPSLQDALEEVAPEGLPLRRVYAITAQLCWAAAAAHDAGVVHRDLKPENILLTKDHAKEDIVKILDFGLAKIMHSADITELTTRGQIFGTPDYMAPEQARGDEIDHRADIYSLGIIAYELVTGRPPFIAKSIPKILYAHQEQLPEPPSVHMPPGAEPLPPGVERIILQCLEKDPERRPRQAAEVAQIFESRLQRQASHTRIVPPIRVGAPPDEKNDWCEVTLDADTFVPTDPDPLSPVPSADVSGEDMATRREWYWGQAVKKCGELIRRLRDHRLGSVELIRLLSRLSDVQEQVVSLETEIALADSRLRELDSMVRDAEARLRYAVVDLSMERGRLVDEGAQKNIYADLDFQIRSLEQRLAGLYKKNDEKKNALLVALRARQERLEHLRQDLTSLEVRLINGVLKARPAQPPAEVLDGYSGLTDLLAALKELT